MHYKNYLSGNHDFNRARERTVIDKFVGTKLQIVPNFGTELQISLVLIIKSSMAKQRVERFYPRNTAARKIRVRPEINFIKVIENGWCIVGCVRWICALPTTATMAASKLFQAEINGGLRLFLV